MSDFDALQNKRNMIVGAFVIIGVLVFAYMVFLFGELPVAVTRFTSYSVKTRFTFAPGVEETTPVRYCGYQIGKVTRVEPPALFEGKDGKVAEVEVEMAIDHKYTQIPANVKVKLGKRGMGSSYIDLMPQPITEKELETLNPKYLQQGMLIPALDSSGSELEIIPPELQNKIDTFLVRITTLTDNLNIIVGDVNNQQNVKKTLANLSKATEESISTLQEIKGFSQTGKEKMAYVSEELGETLIELRRTLNKINSGEGTVGKLVNDETLYNNLVDSSEELKLALEKMKKTFDKTSEKGIKVSVF